MEPTARTRLHRKPARGSYAPDAIHRILDEGLVAHAGFVVDGQPFVIPMVYARLGDEFVLHGAAASRMLHYGATGLPMCVTVSILDALVLARSWFHHSVNYRSVVIFGSAHEITEREAKWNA